MPRRKPLVFETAFAQFREQRLIGSGGAGQVYECIDQDGGVWAIKVLAPDRASTEKLKRFKNEYNFSLRHPHVNIVGVTDSGVVDIGGAKMPFFVMPFFPESLRSLLEAKKVSPNDVLALYAHILNGAEAAHLLKVVHRDLKPENILYDPTTKRLVIADFGIAQFTDDEIFTVVDTAPSTRLASFLYAAPEQRVKGRLVDHRADIYALGLILNEMFTGEVPQGTAFKSIGSVSPENAYLDDLVAEMLRWEPDKRPPSVTVVKEQLIGRGQAFVGRQRLDALRATVVPHNEVSDPLVENPVELVDANWDAGVLTLKLNQAVNNKWVESLQRIGSYQSTAHQPPQAFRFNGNTAQVQANGSDVPHIIQFFKGWLPRASSVYAERFKREARDAEEAERRKLQERIAAAELKERVNRSIKI